MGVGSVCRLRTGAVTCVLEDDGLDSERSFVGVLIGRCSEDLKR